MTLVSTEAQLRSLSPGPERFMTMNLMSSGPCTIAKDFTSYGRAVRRLNTRDHHSTSDVDGAQPFSRTNILKNKPNFHNVADISGTQSVRLHQNTNKPDRALYLDDIEGSRPRNKALFRTVRCINPLVPEYNLPTFAAAPVVVPKFTRDSFDVSDIEGTKSRSLYRFAQRENHVVDDIEGAQVGWKPRHERARKEAPPLTHSLDVRDITSGGFRTRRITNPLEPAYRVNGMDVADDPAKSRPRALPKAKDCPYYTLTTADIEGAQVGWKPMPKMNPPLEARRHFRNTNFMGDISGAQADTLKHSICTNRHVNPLNPIYASLDGEPLVNPQTPLYKEPACKEAEDQLDRTIRVADEAAHMREAEKKSNQSTTHHHRDKRRTRPGSRDTRSAALSSSNDKDRLILRLKQEVEELRGSMDQLPPHPSSMDPTRFSRSASTLSPQEQGAQVLQEADPQPRRRKSFSASSSIHSRTESPGRAPLSGPMGSSERGNTQPMVLRSHSTGGKQGSERLVLRSANGTPRVPLTPAERRMAREYREDVALVQDLT